MGQALIDTSLPVQDQAFRLTHFFESHFKNLSGMSRPIDEWILDCVCQPIYGKLFSIADAVKAVDDICDVYGSSPHFVTDWRWYKDINKKRNGINSLMIDHYFKNIHNLVDYSCIFPERDIYSNVKLLNEADFIYAEALNFQDTRATKHVLNIADSLENIADNMRSIGVPAEQTCMKIYDGAKGLRHIVSAQTPPTCTHFASFFGRGQQYLSFIRL